MKRRGSTHGKGLDRQVKHSKNRFKPAYNIRASMHKKNKKKQKRGGDYSPLKTEFKKRKKGGTGTKPGIPDLSKRPEGKGNPKRPKSPLNARFGEKERKGGQTRGPGRTPSVGQFEIGQNNHPVKPKFHPNFYEENSGQRLDIRNSVQPGRLRDSRQQPMTAQEYRNAFNANRKRRRKGKTGSKDFGINNRSQDLGGTLSKLRRPQRARGSHQPHQNFGVESGAPIGHPVYHTDRNVSNQQLKHYGSSKVIGNEYHLNPSASVNRLPSNSKEYLSMRFIRDPALNSSMNGFTGGHSPLNRGPGGQGGTSASQNLSGLYSSNPATGHQNGGAGEVGGAAAAGFSSAQQILNAGNQLPEESLLSQTFSRKPTTPKHPFLKKYYNEDGTLKKAGVGVVSPSKNLKLVEDLKKKYKSKKGKNKRHNRTTSSQVALDKRRSVPTGSRAPTFMGKNDSNLGVKGLATASNLSNNQHPRYSTGQGGAPNGFYHTNSPINSNAPEFVKVNLRQYEGDSVPGNGSRSPQRNQPGYNHPQIHQESPLYRTHGGSNMSIQVLNRSIRRGNRSIASFASDVTSVSRSMTPVSREPIRRIVSRSISKSPIRTVRIMTSQQKIRIEGSGGSGSHSPLLRKSGKRQPGGLMTPTGKQVPKLNRFTTNQQSGYSPASQAVPPGHGSAEIEINGAELPGCPAGGISTGVGQRGKDKQHLQLKKLKKGKSGKPKGLKRPPQLQLSKNGVGKSRDGPGFGAGGGVEAAPGGPPHHLPKSPANNGVNNGGLKMNSGQLGNPSPSAGRADQDPSVNGQVAGYGQQGYPAGLETPKGHNEKNIGMGIRMGGPGRGFRQQNHQNYQNKPQGNQPPLNQQGQRNQGQYGGNLGYGQDEGGAFGPGGPQSTPQHQQRPSRHKHQSHQQGRDYGQNMNQSRYMDQSQLQDAQNHLQKNHNQGQGPQNQHNNNYNQHHQEPPRKSHYTNQKQEQSPQRRQFNGDHLKNLKFNDNHRQNQQSQQYHPNQPQHDYGDRGNSKTPQNTRQHTQEAQNNDRYPQEYDSYQDYQNGNQGQEEGYEYGQQHQQRDGEYQNHGNEDYGQDGGQNHQNEYQGQSEGYQGDQGGAQYSSQPHEQDYDQNNNQGQYDDGTTGYSNDSSKKRTQNYVQTQYQQANHQRSLEGQPDRNQYHQNSQNQPNNDEYDVYKENEEDDYENHNENKNNQQQQQNQNHLQQPNQSQQQDNSSQQLSSAQKRERLKFYSKEESESHSKRMIEKLQKTEQHLRQQSRDNSSTITPTFHRVSSDQTGPRVPPNSHATFTVGAPSNSRIDTSSRDPLSQQLHPSVHNLPNSTGDQRNEMLEQILKSKTAALKKQQGGQLDVQEKQLSLKNSKKQQNDSPSVRDIQSVKTNPQPILTAQQTSEATFAQEMNHRLAKTQKRPLCLTGHGSQPNLNPVRQKTIAETLGLTNKGDDNSGDLSDDDQDDDSSSIYATSGTSDSSENEDDDLDTEDVTDSNVVDAATNARTNGFPSLSNIETSQLPPRVNKNHPIRVDESLKVQTGTYSLNNTEIPISTSQNVWGKDTFQIEELRQSGAQIESDRREIQSNILHNQHHSLNADFSYKGRRTYQPVNNTSKQLVPSLATGNINVPGRESHFNGSQPTSQFSSTNSPNFKSQADNGTNTAHESQYLREFSLQASSRSRTEPFTEKHSVDNTTTNPPKYMLRNPSQNHLVNSRTFSMEPGQRRSAQQGIDPKSTFTSAHNANIFKKKAADPLTFMNEELKSSEDKYRQLSQEHVQLQTENQELRTYIEQIQDDHAKQMDAMEMLNRENMLQFEGRYKEVVNELEAKVNRVLEAYKTQKGKKNKERKKRKKQKSEMSSEINSRDSLIEALRAEIGALKQNVDGLTKQLCQIKEKAGEAATTNKSSLTKTYSESVLESHLLEAQSKIDSLEKKNRRLRKEVKGFKKMSSEFKELEKSRQAFDELKKKVIVLVNENNRLNQLVTRAHSTKSGNLHGRPVGAGVPDFQSHRISPK